MESKTSDALKKGTLATVGVAGAAAAGWWVYSRWFIDHSKPLPKALDAELDEFVLPGFGRVNYYCDTAAKGVPLLLVHSINAAASSYELKPLFERFRSERPVYSVDLPGFGYSARPDVQYTPDLYVDAIIAMLDRIQQPADVVALSLSSEFAARAALLRPGLFRSLTFVSPTGLDERSRSAASAVRGAWTQPLFDLLSTSASIRYFLRKSFDGPVDQGMVDYALATTHQPGARFAPLAFISGRLFTPDILPNYYEHLRVPVLVLYDKDAYTSFDELPALLERRENWRAERIAGTRGLPQFDRPAETSGALLHFWHGAPLIEHAR